MIEERLAEILPPPNGNRLIEAMLYALLGPGKRIRPLLVLATAETFGASKSLALDPGVAIEMVHAYSLIHDDLPSMDNDDLRRGRPTVHRAFSEAIAILAGDALLTDAFRVIAESKGLSDHQIVRLIRTLALRAGSEGMVGGQMIDISCVGSISQDLLMEMHRKKTGDLLSCSLEFGAIIAKASPAQEEILRQIGHHLGLAYQIRDDLEDVQQMADEGKPTAVTVFGLKKARELLEQSLAAIITGLDRLPGRALPISNIITSLFKAG